MKFVCISLAAVAVVTFSGAMWAQAPAGMGGLSGTVRDSQGASIPGAQVVVVNADKGIRRTIETNDAGIFAAPALVPAPGYEVKIEKSGFAAYEAKNVEILVGQQVDLGVILQIASASSKIEVVATTPLVDTTKTNVSQVVESAQIQDLPINGRRVDSFVLLTPGVTNDSTYGLLSFRGIAGGNAFLVDGNDTTEQFYNENAGRTRIHSQLSQDAVQEFQVISSNFTPEYGRATGGVVNTITRSGTNTVHGGAYWLFRNQDFNARDRYATFNPPETRYTAGASIGGPIVKEKLFYFFNADVTRRNFPMAASLLYPGTVDPTTEQFVQGGTSGCGLAYNGKTPTAAQCSAINAILPRYFGQINRQANQELAFGKLDWRPSDRNSFSASFNFLHFVSPNGIQTAAALTTSSSLSGNGDDSVRVRNGRLGWTGIPSANAVNEFHFSWFTDRQADDFDPAELIPGIGYLNLKVGAISSLGATYYLPRVEPSEQRFQFADNLTWTRGKHTYKFGMDIAHSRDYTFYISDYFGYYNYSSVSAFALDFSGNTTGAKNWSSYTQAFGNPVVNAAIQDNGFYAQDAYKISPRLTLNYGMRYEYAALPQPAVINPDYSQTGHINSPTLNLEPRIGIAYSLDKTNKTVVRASYGMFHARFPGSLIDNLWSNNGVYQLTSTFSSTNATQLAAGPVYPYVLTTQPSNATGSSSIQFMAPNARTPYTEQGTLAVERELGNGMALTVSYLWNRGLQMLTVRNLNLGNPSGSATYTIDNASGQAVSSFSTPVWMTADRINTKYTNVFQVENDINSYYNAAVVQFQKKFSRGFWANASYTWAHEIDDGQGNATNALYFSSVGSSGSPVTYNGDYKFDKGSGNLDQRHRLVISFSAQPTFTHRNGAFYKYVVNNWMLNGIVTFQSGRPETAYILTQDTPVTGMLSNSTLNGFGGFNRVPFWPVNSLYTPPVKRADLILGKRLPFGGDRLNAQFRFEAYNITNTIVDTSEISEAFTEKGKVLTPYSAYGLGNASGGFPDGTNARRLQLALRFAF